MSSGQVTLITLRKDNGDHWICETPDGTAWLWSSMANDYPDDTVVLASMVPNTNPSGPKWFVNGVAHCDTPVTVLDGIHEGYDPYLNLMSKARLCRKIIDLSDRSKVWYAPNDSEIYVEEFEYD